MDQAIIFTAEYALVIPVVVMGALLAWRVWKHKDYKYLAFVVLGGIISLALAKLSGQLISHQQPFITDGFEPLIHHEADNSFPSDHTLLAAYLAFAVMTKRQKIGLALLAVAILIGTCRHLAGVHHVVDIAASFGLALVGAVAAYWLTKKVFGSRTPAQDQAD